MLVWFTLKYCSVPAPSLTIVTLGVTPHRTITHEMRFFRVRLSTESPHPPLDSDLWRPHHHYYVVSVITNEAFETAFLDGDLDTIAAYIAQPSGREEIDATEAYIARHAPPKPTFYMIGGGPYYPWFCGSHPRGGTRDNDQVLLVATARFGHAHIIHWFFSHERILFMRATLVLLLRPVLLYDEARMLHTHVWTSDPHILEMLIQSHTFQHDRPEPIQQALLDDVAMYSRNPHVVHLAISHGACIGQPTTLAAVAWHDRTGVVDLLAKEGAFVVGADVLQRAAWSCNDESTDRLLRYGADWGNATTRPLIISANQMDHTRDMVGASLAMENGFFDVDARDSASETALMTAARFNECDDDEYLDFSGLVAQSLLDYGATVELECRNGRTAMWYARRADNDKVAAVLLAAGAHDDPSWVDDEDSGGAYVEEEEEVGEEEEAEEEEEEDEDDGANAVELWTEIVK